MPPLFLSKLRNKSLIRRFLLLGESLQVIQKHPAEDRVVFLVRDPPVQRRLLDPYGGILPHETYQDLPGPEGFTDPVQDLQRVLYLAVRIRWRMMVPRITLSPCQRTGPVCRTISRMAALATSG